jgi:hypothetical protein
MSMSGHQSPKAKSTTWLTPPEWIEALGPFDLDPCCPPVMPWPTAARMLTEREDGLKTPWEGRVWLNPPFGREWPAWVEKLADHGNGIALIPARTETEAFLRLVWGRADAICFTGPHRPHFHRADGTRAPFNSGAPIALVAFDGDWRLKRPPLNCHKLQQAGLGPVVVEWHRAMQPHTEGKSK